MSGNRTHYPYLSAVRWRKSGLALIVSATGAPYYGIPTSTDQKYAPLHATVYGVCKKIEVSTTADDWDDLYHSKNQKPNVRD